VVTWLNKVGREMEMLRKFGKGEPWVKTHSKETQNVKNYHKTKIKINLLFVI